MILKAENRKILFYEIHQLLDLYNKIKNTKKKKKKRKKFQEP